MREREGKGRAKRKTNVGRGENEGEREGRSGRRCPHCQSVLTFSETSQHHFLSPSSLVFRSLHSTTSQRPPCLRPTGARGKMSDDIASTVAGVVGCQSLRYLQTELCTQSQSLCSWLLFSLPVYPDFILYTSFGF